MRLGSPVGHKPLEGGMFEEHEENTNKDADNQQQIETSVLTKMHPFSLALQLAVVSVVVTLASPIIEVLEVL